MRDLDGQLLARLLEVIGPELNIEIVPKLPRRIVGNVQKNLLALALPLLGQEPDKAGKGHQNQAGENCLHGQDPKAQN